jgi:hypothetical protein
LKYERTPQFDADLKRLSSDEFRAFRDVVRNEFEPACERRIANPSAAWPRHLRVKKLEGTTGVYEMTWSFSGPDGRATFEWITVGEEARIRWRRIGGHAIFKKP